LDREALVIRNQMAAEAFHSMPYKHQVRRMLLRMAAHIPTPSIRRARQERILFIRPDHIGDLLLTTPAIRALKQAHPGLDIHMLVGPWSSDLLSSYPDVGMALTLPFPGFSRSPNESLRQPYQLALKTAQRLRRIGYSTAVILRPDHWWGALVAKLAGIPVRIGYDLPDVAPFLTQGIAFQREHAIRQNLRLVESWTGAIPDDAVEFRFPVSPLDSAYIDGYLDEWGVQPTERIVCIHPGTGTWVKHWVEERWATVADFLTEQLNARVVLTGSNRELNLLQRIQQTMKQQAVLAAGDTNLGQLAALFARARVVLGPDSGPLHLAAAVNTPTVTLFGPADPAEFGPWGKPELHPILTSDLKCRPCGILDWESDDPSYHPCLRDITVPRVLEAARMVAR
jgi:heptosyltransferase-2/heptosyltransferase-3